MSEKARHLTVEQYIAAAPEDIRPALQRMRALIRAAAPDAVETIAYGMPTYKGRRSLVHYAAAKTHLGFYPTPSAIVRFKQELSQFETSKGAIRFPYARPLPEALITAIVKFRMEEDSAK